MSDYTLRQEQTIEHLKRASDGIEIRYNAPVYLVGSYHSKGNQALDVDIVIVFSNEQLKKVFGPNYFGQNFTEKNFRFRNKQRQWYWNHSPLNEYDIDFKEQSIDAFKFHYQNSVGLATRLGSYADVCYVQEIEAQRIDGE